MKMNIDVIKDKLQKDLKFLASTYKVKNIGFFGSVARGDNTASSDIDILVEFSEPIGMFKFIDLEKHLEKLAGIKVDLVTEKALKPAISQEIMREVVYV